MENNSIDLANISDLGKLRELYIEYSESLMQATEQTQRSSANLDAVRIRMSQIYREQSIQSVEDPTPAAKKK